MEQKSNKTIVRECYRKIIRDLDLSLVDSYIKEDYIQHSPTVKEGKAGLLEMLLFLKAIHKPKEEMPSPIIRVIADGDFVAVHLDIVFMGKRAAVVDLFRLEGGKIAEHWDCAELIEEEGGVVTMTNGTTQIDESVDANKSNMLVQRFYNELFEYADLNVGEKFLHSGYIEHSPLSGLLNKREGIIKVHRIIAEGDFVVLQCECKNEGSAFALYDILRVKDNTIAEHWCVKQKVPDEMAHNNGMF